MAKTKKKAPRKKSPTQSKAIILSEIKLPEKQRSIISLATPEQFVKTRKGKGGKTFTYVEGGYVVARLNEIFSPIGWQFEVVDERVEPNEVSVRGKLTIKDFKTGFEVSKTQYGSQERRQGMALGDALKGASTDSLKKCASLFGIALDIYWPQLDAGNEKVVKIEKSSIKTKKDLMQYTMSAIQKENNPVILAEMIHKIKTAKPYSANEKQALTKAIDDKIGKAIQK